MKKKKDEDTEATENVKKKKKAPIIIAIVVLLVIIGSCNANGDKDNFISDSSTSSSESSVAESTDESKEEPTTKKTTEEKTTASDIDISPETFVSAVEEAIHGTVDSSNERITNVDFTDGTLTISVDLSEADTTIIPLEDLAVVRAQSITDYFLELEEYEDLWNEVIIDFGALGRVKKSKSDIIESSYGRYFDITEIEK